MHTMFLPCTCNVQTYTERDKTPAKEAAANLSGHTLQLKTEGEEKLTINGNPPGHEGRHVFTLGPVCVCVCARGSHITSPRERLGRTARETW